MAFVASVTACHGSRPVLYADTEGLRAAAEPPLLRPARIADAGLRSAQRGQLVVRFELNYQPNATGVTLRATAGMQATAGTQTPVEQSVDASGVTAFRGLIPGEYTVTARRIGFQSQSMRVLVAAGFADTLVFHLGQP
jgi:hypothetical protein